MLKGKAAVVTGSTSGIGLGIARALAAEGVQEVLLISQDSTFYGIDRGERAKVEPSDHVPVWCELDVA